jgi:hypothetical protein
MGGEGRGINGETEGLGSLASDVDDLAFVPSIEGGLVSGCDCGRSATIAGGVGAHCWLGGRNVRFAGARIFNDTTRCMVGLGQGLDPASEVGFEKEGDMDGDSLLETTSGGSDILLGRGEEGD